MSGDNGIHLQLLHALIQSLKFQVAIAVNAGVGRTAVSVGIYETIHNLFFEICREIKDVIRHMQTISNTARIFYIVQRAACFFPFDAGLFVLKQFHCDAGACISFLLHQQCGYRAVYAAAHGDQSFFHDYAPFSLV